MATHAGMLGTLKYQTENGHYILFPGDCNTKIESKNVPTSDGRSIKYVEHTMTVSGWLYSTDLPSATGTVDSAFANARQILAQSGGILTIRGKGFGDYTINQNSNNNRDVKWGPHTEVVTWEPIGNITCRFEWVVKFTLPWKDNAATRVGILDYTWETEYNYDAEGFCSRTTNLEMEMTGTRAVPGLTFVPANDHIEQWLDQVICTCPVGWRRTGHRFTISKDKSRATFTFTDESDKGFPFFPGIADMDVIHEMTSQNGNMTLSNWLWTISITATPQAQFPSFYGYQACLAAHQARFAYLVRNLVNSSGSIIPYPVQFKITERCRSRTTSLVAAWSLVVGGKREGGPVMPVDILYRSGLWQPFAWSSRDFTQVADQPYGPNTTGGYSKMVSDPSQNIIMDVSSIESRIPDPGLIQRGIQPLQKGPPAELLIQTPFGAYIEFRVWLSVRSKGGKWINYPLANDTNRPNVTFNSNIAQKIGEYNIYRVEGVIVRIGIPPAELPAIRKIGSVDVEYPSDKEKYVKTEPIMNTAGLLIWRTSFSIPVVTVVKDDSNPVKSGSHGKKPGNTVLIKGKDGQLIEVPKEAKIE